MKHLVSLISLILFIAGLWYLWVHYDELAEAMSRTVYQTTGYKSRQNQYDPKKDPSSQEFRDELSKKLYGTKNYEDMKDPNMASRIYNERMQLPTAKERQKAKEQARQKSRK